MTDLGHLGGGFSYAYDINESGQIVGYSDNADGNRRAVLWENGTMTDLDTLGGGFSSAYDINESGQIIGDYVPGNFRAVLWQNGTMTDLGHLGGGDSLVRHINDSGQIVGGSYTADDNRRAFLWENGTMTELGTLGGNSGAYDINESGQIVGYSLTVYSKSHAVLWENGTMTDLLPIRGIDSNSHDINDAGQVLGTYDISRDESFLWEKGKAVDLRNLITPNSGWDSLYGQKINNNGQIIGRGLFQGKERAFFMNPTDQIIDPELISEPIPEPSTVIGSILGLGTLATTARRRGKRSKTKSVGL